MSRRRSVHVEGLGHGSVPIPSAAIVGNVVCSGGISGIDREKHEYPATLEGEAACMFDNLRATIAACGGTTADIVKVTMFVTDRGHRSAIDPEWVAEFPDPDDRPARHTLVVPLADPMHMQCEVLAVLPGAD